MKKNSFVLKSHMQNYLEAKCLQLIIFLISKDRNKEKKRRQIFNKQTSLNTDLGLTLEVYHFFAQSQANPQVHHLASEYKSSFLDMF